MLKNHISYSMFLSENKIPYLKKEKEYPYYSKANHPDNIVELFNVFFKAQSLPEEHVWVLSLNNSCDILGIFEVSHGTASFTVISPREIFMRALLSGASSIVVIHNHPTGDVSPSEADLAFATRVKEAGDILNIPVADFIIIGDTYCSFKEEERI